VGTNRRRIKHVEVQSRARRVVRALFFSLSVAYGSAYAQSNEFQIGLGLIDFGYQEFSESGSLIDREDALLPAVFIEAARRAGPWRLSAGWRFFSGTADHQGRTNFGVPITTETRERLQSLAFRAAHDLQLLGWQVSPYAGFGYHEWRRDIQSTRTASGASVNGLLERYSWTTVEVGALAHIGRWAQLEGMVDIRVFRILDPKLKVHFSGGFDDARLALGEESGFRIGVISAYPMDKSMRLRAEVYYERWSFGRSTAEPLTTNGRTVGTVLEPRSETNITGVTVGVLFGF